ncbi:MAG: DUF1338 domain-containing protein [Lentisphaeraceae bacterium]|nr:DUF1338 domain-containing protein [Lentisphaeraceae bacterium]
MDKLDTLFENLWEQYSSVNLQAGQIHSLLRQRGENIENDHIAFRTYGLPKINMEVLAGYFKEFGYEEKGQYEFTEKKLLAKHYELEGYPRVFISELIVEEFSPFLQETVKNLVAEVDEKDLKDNSFLYSGVPWSKISHSTYCKLRDESEYAAWMAVFGFVANHFTISVNALKSFKGLADLNIFIKDSGFPLNTSGGEIKGSAEVYLAQSSTLASEIRVNFGDEDHFIPGCYYEFAERFPMPNGQLYSGFIASSADKIFESTDVQK